MSFQHYAVLVIWDYALPDGWELNAEHNNWPTNPVIDGLAYSLVSKRYNDAVYALDIEAFKKTSQMTEQAIGLLEDDLVNAKVENKMLKEQVELVAAAEDIVENLLDPGDTRLADLQALLEGYGKLDANISKDNQRLTERNAKLETVIGHVSKTLSEDIAAAEDAKLHTDSGNISSQMSSKIHALNKIQSLLHTLLQETAMSATRLVGEVTLTELELDYLARYEQEAVGLMTWAIRNTPENQRLSKKDYYHSLLNRKDLPANRAAIERRRKELGLSE